MSIEDLSVVAVVVVSGEMNGEVGGGGVEDDDPFEDGERCFLFPASRDDIEDEMAESNDDVESDAEDGVIAGDSADALTPRLSGFPPIRGVEHVDEGDDMDDRDDSLLCLLLAEFRPMNRLLTNSCITSSSSGSNPPPWSSLPSPTSSRISNRNVCNVPRHSHEGTESTICCNGNAIRASKHASAGHDSSTCRADLHSNVWICIW